MFDLLCATLASRSPSPPACPNGATAAPNASWAACFSLPEQRASSLRQCVEWCGELGMTPACIGSAEENAFAAGLVPADDWAFIGIYQNDTSGAPAEGWGRCVAGEASGFANWQAGQPNDGLVSEECAMMTARGHWYDEMCGMPPALGYTFRCLCEGPSRPSDSFERDLRVLEASVETVMRKAQARVAMG